MRIDDSGKRTKVWLDDAEADRLQRTLEKTAWERGIAGMLMLRCGLRSEETTTVTPGDVERGKDGKSWFLEVQGKNTKGGQKTTRKAWLPDDVERELLKFSRERGIEDDEPYLDVTPRTVQNWISNESETGAADVLARDENEPDEWKHVSSHDLRRHWAHHHLVEEKVPVRVMMAIGGWSSYSAIEPYLTTPSEDNIIQEMRAVQ